MIIGVILEGILPRKKLFQNRSLSNPKTIVVKEATPLSFEVPAEEFYTNNHPCDLCGCSPNCHCYISSWKQAKLNHFDRPENREEV